LFLYSCLLPFCIGNEMHCSSAVSIIHIARQMIVIYNIYHHFEGFIIYVHSILWSARKKKKRIVFHTCTLFLSPFLKLERLGIAQCPLRISPFYIHATKFIVNWRGCIGAALG
jgi:hypothetical protein